jgi:hypothetical protein
VRDSYIVVFKPGTSASEQIANDVAKAHGADVRRVYNHALRGMTVRASREQIARMQRDPRVAYIEANGVVKAIDSQAGATWGLDRIDQRALPLDTTYNYQGYGTDVHAYVIDTGIYAEHEEFAGRVLEGADLVDNDSTPQDCHGHGSHVAGTVLGTTYGVAKQAMLHGVRVLDCVGSGSTADVIAGIDWVTANHIKPAVANMSLGGGFSQALNDAVANSVAAGVTYAVAAGNESSDACGRSPASTPEALTIAASDSSDLIASFSNKGTCVDLFAPGVDITSAAITSPTSTSIKSGTSMASPHVAGVAALYLGAFPDATPAEVAAAIVEQATPDVITNPGSGTPNLLVYMGDFPGDNRSLGRIVATAQTSCSGTIHLRLTDSDLSGIGTQGVAITTSGGDSESVTLLEDPSHPGRFELDLALATGAVVVGDGTVQVGDAQEVVATYQDADNGNGEPALASDTTQLDCSGPVLSNVHLIAAAGTSARIGADASEPAKLQAKYATSCASLTSTSPYGAASLHPETTLSGLTKDSIYYYTVQAEDALGNVATDDNGGSCYSFKTAKSLLSESFESGLGSFPTVTGLWHAASGCASASPGHTQPGTLYYGIDASCDFDNDSTNSGTARSIPVSIDLDASPFLHLNYFLGTEGGSIYDRADIGVSINGGANTVIASSYGVGVPLTQNSDVWQPLQIDLSTLGTGSATLELVFGFNSVDSVLNNYAGFYVDDVEIIEGDQATCASDEECNDGQFCNGVETCVDEHCVPGTFTCSSDEVSCTIETCDEEIDLCVSNPDDTLCDNGLFCDGDETCTSSGCVAGIAPCEDGVACTLDSCNEEGDSCLFLPDNEQCDNGLFCDGTELCSDTGCISGPLPCAEGNSCDEAGDTCCAPESDAEFCARAGAQCGSISAVDNCGTPRTVDSCGTCTEPETCGGNGIPNACGAAPVDRTEGGSASATGTPCSSSEGGAKAYDNLFGPTNFTRWCVTSAPSAASAIATAYDFAGSTTYAINRYTITTANDNPSRDPKNWTLQGCQGTCSVTSNSGWTNLDTRTNEFVGAGRLETRSYNVANTTAYQQYRVRFTGNQGSSNRFALAEIQMFGAPGCAPESDATFCSRVGKNCGTVNGTDNCGSARTVNSCGTCTAPQTCGGSGSANVCGVDPNGPCSSPAWSSSASYSNGSVVTDSCQVSTTGTVCYNNVGKQYAWRCDYSTFCYLRPGSSQAGWWSAWTAVQTCN